METMGVRECYRHGRYAVFNNVITIAEGRNLVRRQGMLLQLRRTIAAILPDGWFELHSLGDADFDRGHEHYMLERVGGPPIGSFHLWHDGVHVQTKALPELDPAVDEPAWKGCYRDVPSAVAAIARMIDDQLQAWRLPPLGVRGTH